MTDQPSHPYPGAGTPAGSPYATPPGTPYSASAPPPQGPAPTAPPPVQEQNPYAVTPAQQNRYAPAPAVGPGPPASPESLAAVEARFGPVATFGDRVPAYLIDLAITLSGLVLVVLGFIVLWSGSGGSVTLDNGATAQTPSDPMLVLLGWLLVVAGYLAMLGLWLWNRVFTMGRTGQSVGNRTQGLRLIDARTGEPIGAGSSFLREVVQGLANQVFYLSFLWMLWDPHRQTLADKAVHSTVIRVPKDDTGAAMF